jgi:hypothetical protein
LFYSSSRWFYEEGLLKQRLMVISNQFIYPVFILLMKEGILIADICIPIDLLIFCIDRIFQTRDSGI